MLQGHGMLNLQPSWLSSTNSSVSSYFADRPHCCSYCGKRFLNTSHLRDHVRLHTGERPFRCNTCGKTFVQNQHLRQHKKNAKCGGILCQICNSNFPNKHLLTIHMASIHMINSNVLPFSN